MSRIRLISYKLFAKNNIPLKNINGLTIENRHFIGEGRWSKRKALVISYIEDSGYGAELVLTYDMNLHHYIEKMSKDIYEK